MPTPVGPARATGPDPETPAHRATAAAGPIPVSTMPAPTGALSEGHPPAHRRPAISTRVHQSGGQPTRPGPARGPHPARPPPVAQQPAHDPLRLTQTAPRGAGVKDLRPLRGRPTGRSLTPTP